MSDEGLKKVVPLSILAGVGIGALCLFLMGCAALGMGSEPVSAEPSVWEGAAKGVVTAVSTASPPAGAILAGLFGAYQLSRKRSREKWVSATKNIATGRLNEAVKDIDKALGGGHTSDQSS